MTTRLQDWLNLTHEEALEPSLPICDPHHHLWDYPDSLPEERVPVYTRQVRHYLLNDLLTDTSDGHRIVKTVFVECTSMYRRGGPSEMRPVGETEFVNGLATQSASGLYGDIEASAGIIGFADLLLGDAVAPVLEAHLAAAPARFRGIRYISTWDPTNSLSSRAKVPHLLAEAKFRVGFARLRRYGLSFDAWLYHNELGDVTGLAQAFPDTPVVLDHIGGPIGVGTYAGKRNDVLADWKKSIAALATCPNVAVKLGGMGMAMMGFGWHERPKPPDSAELAAAMAPYLDWCIEKFGPQRCMFESNFPVDKASYSYTVLWNAFKRYSKGFSATERAALFHDTASTVYRLGA